MARIPKQLRTFVNPYMRIMNHLKAGKCLICDGLVVIKVEFENLKHYKFRGDFKSVMMNSNKSFFCAHCKIGFSFQPRFCIDTTNEDGEEPEVAEDQVYYYAMIIVDRFNVKLRGLKR